MFFVWFFWWRISVDFPWICSKAFLAFRWRCLSCGNPRLERSKTSVAPWWQLETQENASVLFLQEITRVIQLDPFRGNQIRRYRQHISIIMLCKVVILLYIIYIFTYMYTPLYMHRVLSCWNQWIGHHSDQLKDPFWPVARVDVKVLP